MTREQLIKNVKKMKRRAGRAEYLRYLNDETVTRQEAIKAKCWECTQGEDTQPCIVLTCPLTQYCQWNK